LPAAVTAKKKPTEDDDRDLDIEFRPHRVFDPFCKTREHVCYNEAGDEREDIGAFIRESERPADTELLQLGGCYSREVCKIADHPARIGNPEYCGEGQREFLEVAFQCDGCRTQHNKQRDVGRD
jgi:hypothetical protein